MGVHSLIPGAGYVNSIRLTFMGSHVFWMLPKYGYASGIFLYAFFALFTTYAMCNILKCKAHIPQLDKNVLNAKPNTILMRTIPWKYVIRKVVSILLQPLRYQMNQFLLLLSTYILKYFLELYCSVDLFWCFNLSKS